VDRGVAVDVGTSRGEVQAGRERRKRTKRGSSSVGRSPYSRTRWWLRRRKWRGVAITVGGEAATAVSWARAGRRRPLSEEVCTVQMQSARGSDRAADGWAPRGFDFSNLTKTGSKLEFEKEHLTLL
jgi:hypothetical protein